MLWIKAWHIFFVTAWFAGLFYLPRIYVNLAGETNAVVTERLLLMAHKLFRFMTLIAVPAVGLGLWLSFSYGIGNQQGWLHAKLSIVVLLIAYHIACGKLLSNFKNCANTRSHRWYRVFNEIPAFALLAIVVLVVVKPF